MKLYCNECYSEIEGGSVLLTQVLEMAEGDIAILIPKASMQKFCMGCAAQLAIELQARFNGKVDEKLLALVHDFKNFLRNDHHNGIENVIAYLRDGVNFYFGYDDTEKNFFEGELIQFRLLTTEEAHTILEETYGILEHIPNHIFVTLNGTAFTVEEGNLHLKQH